MNKRLEPKLRAENILDAALIVARTDGFRNMTRDTVAARAGCSPGLVSYYFSTMPQLRRSVMRAAISRRVVEVVAEGIALKDKYALQASPELRKLVSAHLDAR